MIKDEKLKSWYFSQENNQRNTIVKIFGVEYAHMVLDNGDDLYVTKFGLPFIDHLYPENYYTDKAWFRSNSTKLIGTSCVYRVTTKEINGKSKNIVMKWNRMGQDVPGATQCDDLIHARFNSPFEEFGLVEELRAAMYADSYIPHIIQKPLAIYVPVQKDEIERMGRRVYEMEKIISDHTEIDIDMQRSYAVIYEWIKGIDIAEAYRSGLLDEPKVRELTIAANLGLHEKGYVVRDNKPQHIIVRQCEDKSILSRPDGQYPNAIVDFELLLRTPEQEEKMKKDTRLEYHKRQTQRFVYDSEHDFHPHLMHTKHLGVDYVYGQVESTKGRLWVLGSDPHLFDFFLPERWEKTQKTRVSMFSESYYTATKDNIHIVWEVSKVGMIPDADPFKHDEKRILDFGHNSPFEEVSMAIYLGKQGLSTIYPRAIYMSGSKAPILGEFFDSSRFDSHREFVSPDGEILLLKDHEYIIIWGYWNGPDEVMATGVEHYYTGINALRAYREGRITDKDYMRVLRDVKKKLKKVNVEDLNLSGSHLLFSLDQKGQIVRDGGNMPAVRICNFEFLKRVSD